MSNSMERLPADILTHHIFPLLYDKSINLGLTCKRLYILYVRKRDCDRRIAKRFERVKSKFNECCANEHGIGITLDRMYILHPYGLSHLIILVKYYQPNYMALSGVDLFIHYTVDQWKTVKRERLRFVDSYRRGPLLESTWAIYFSKLFIKYEKIWFAIEAICTEKHIWDNNNGWNYDISDEHHWIPDYPDNEKYRRMDYPYSVYFPHEGAVLNEWLYNHNRLII